MKVSFSIRLIALAILVMVSFCSDAQVSWKFSSKKVANQTYELHLTATVNDPWHIYSQSTPPGGPHPTEIKLNKNPLVTLQGKVKEQGEMEEYHDQTFDVDVYAFSNKVDFVQTVKIKGNLKTNISGSVTFMACTKQQCMPPDNIKFNIKLD